MSAVMHGPFLALSTAGGIGGARFAVAVALSLGVHAGAALWIERVAMHAPSAAAPARSVQVRLVAAPRRDVLSGVAAAERLTPVAAPAAVPVAARAADTVPAQALRAVAPAAARPVRPPRARAVAMPASAARAAVPRAQPARPPRPAPAVPEREPAAPPPVAAAADRVAPAVPVPAAVPAARAAVREPPQPRPPRPVADNPQPEYPLLARRRGQQGRVVLRLEVSPEGTALQARVIESSGIASLDSAARAAVARWRFVPARHEGRAVAATVDVPVVFRLDARG